MHRALYDREHTGERYPSHLRKSHDQALNINCLVSRGLSEASGSNHLRWSQLGGAVASLASCVGVMSFPPVSKSTARLKSTSSSTNLNISAITVVKTAIGGLPSPRPPSGWQL